jgi:type IIA topoisomerase (DNA gyrase/topo II, topoisomerase IV), B subunit
MIKTDTRNSKLLSKEDQVREKPALIFGTNDEKGAFHTFEEVVANSIDEAREGWGGRIDITVETGDIITVEDWGRGLPMGKIPGTNEYNWERNLCTLYSSGKYGSEQYKKALGTNGVGLSATQFASEFMEVYSTYDGETKYMCFKEGKPVTELKVMAPVKEGTGTKIRYKPDSYVFPVLKRISLEPSMFLTYLIDQAMLQKGIEIRFKHYGLEDEVVLKYDNGMAEYIDSVIEGKRYLSESAYYTDKVRGNDEDTPDLDDYDVEMHLAFNFAPDTSLCKVYHNASFLFEQGDNKTVTALQTGFTRAFNEIANANGKLGKNDTIVYKDIESLLVCIGATDAPGNRTWFKNQTKGAITNTFITKAFREFVFSKVKYWAESNKDIANKVLDAVIANMRARIEGAEVSKKVVRKLKKAIDFKDMPKTFKDASSKIVIERELYIVEGNSAMGAVKQACIPRIQGIYTLRGKVTNCLKEKITKALNNEIITDLYRVLGCGMEVHNKNIEDLPEFDINRLKWGKIIICTDADYDGYHIRCLLLGMMYVLSPSLLKSGRVYIAETPLYEVSYKNEIQFAYDDNEKQQLLDYFRDKGAKEGQVIIQRSKGLGENDPEMMHKSTMAPETRRLIPVEMDDDEEEVRNYFTALLGDDIETRRILIDEYFDKYDSEE